MRKFVRGNGKLATGVAGVLVFALFMIAVFEKQAILTALSPGDTVRVEFPRDYKLDVNSSQVKIAGTPVGVVSSVEKTGRGTEMVSLKVDDGVVDKLGTAPSAEIRPTTVLGGKYYISLRSDGAELPFDTDTVIPVNRTHTPVELEQVLQAFPGDARQGLRDTSANLDQTLAQGGKDGLRDILHDAPGTLAPGGQVLDALRGNRPSDDLSSVVTNVDSIANVLTRRDGQLGNVVDNLDTTTGVLARQSRPLASTVSTLPPVLRTTRAGLTDLGHTLDRVPATADAARPAVRELAPVLNQLDPVLARTRPVLRDLHPLLDQARPLVQDLVPTGQKGTGVLNDLRGPVLDRVNGPIAHSLMTEWHGKPPKYPNGGDGAKFYQEIAYLVTNINNGNKVIGPNGYMINFALGAGSSSVMDPPLGLDQLTQNLSTMMGPPHQPGQPYNLGPVVDTLQKLAPQQVGAQQHGTPERPPS